MKSVRDRETCSAFLVSPSRRDTLEEEVEKKEEDEEVVIAVVVVIVVVEEERGEDEKEKEEEKDEEGDSCGVKVPLCCRLFPWLEHS